MFRPCKWAIIRLFVEPVGWLYNRSLGGGTRSRIVHCIMHILCFRFITFKRHKNNLNLIVPPLHYTSTETSLELRDLPHTGKRDCVCCWRYKSVSCVITHRITNVPTMNKQPIKFASVLDTRLCDEVPRYSHSHCILFNNETTAKPIVIIEDIRLCFKRLITNNSHHQLLLYLLCNNSRLQTSYILRFHRTTIRLHV